MECLVAMGNLKGKINHLCFLARYTLMNRRTISDFFKEVDYNVVLNNHHC